MLALGIILVRRPQILLLDEPSAGLAPALVKETAEKVKNINRRFGTSILFVEQNVKEAPKICDRVYLIRDGKIVGEEKPQALKERGLEAVFFGDVPFFRLIYVSLAHNFLILQEVDEWLRWERKSCG